MKSLITIYFIAVMLLLTTVSCKAQEVISLEETLEAVNHPSDQIKKSNLDSVDVFISQTPGALREVIEKSKGQGSLYISKVAIKGNINFQDLYYLCSLPFIENLDLSQSNIIGDKLRSANVFPSGVFSDLNNHLNRIVLPKSLIAIDRLAFSGLTKLEEVNIPEGCRAIGESAFSNTLALNLITLPEGLMFIDDSAFAGSGIEIISLPANIISLGRSAFQGSRLKYFSSEKVRECSFVNDEIFADCHYLEFAGFHYKARIFGEKVFDNTPNLKVIRLASPLPPYLMDNGILTMKKNADVQIPENSLAYYKKKRIWRKLSLKLVTDFRNPKILFNRIQCDSIYKQIHCSQDIATNTLYHDNFSIPVDSFLSKVNSVQKVIREKKFKSEIDKHEMLETILRKDSFNVESIDTLFSATNPKINPIGEKCEHVLTPAKTYWITGKLFVETSHKIKMVNLITLDGVYVYGKFESDNIWSFKIEVSKVASIRVSYDGFGTPEIINLKK